MRAASSSRVEFRQQSPGFYRDRTGRFDLVFVPGATAHGVAGYWLAADWEAGRVFRHHDSAAAENWCEKQAGGG